MVFVDGLHFERASLRGFGAMLVLRSLLMVLNVCRQFITVIRTEFPHCPLQLDIAIDDEKNSFLDNINTALMRQKNCLTGLSDRDTPKNNHRGKVRT